MAASRNSGRLPVSEALLTAALLAAVSVAAAWWVFQQGFTLYYGDATAHVNIARRVLDSRTPGWYQIGTVWLPLPHVLMLPFVQNDEWWRNGLAGVIPSAAAYIAGGLFFYAAMRRAFASRAPAIVALAVLALNSNLLYLQSTPMTEPLFLAELAALLYFTVRFEETRSVGSVVGASLTAVAGALTRYEGWFLIPFVTLYFALKAKRRRLLYAALFVTVASLGPLYWLFHNWFWWGDALEFYHGPWSAKAIYERALAGGMARYPGDQDWATAWLQFREAARLCAGWPLAVLGLAGSAVALVKRAWWPVLLLSLPAVFYVWSLHSGGTPIFVPHLWPNTYYNTRYGLAALPLLAFGSGALVAVLPAWVRPLSAAAVVLAGLSPWLLGADPQPWICWRESQVNSEARRAWTKEAAGFLRENYRPGTGIIHAFGDVTGVLQQAGIPLRESLHTGNVPHFDAAVSRPDLFLWEEWAIVMSGDKIADALVRARRSGPRYELMKSITLRLAPAIEIYRRAGRGLPLEVQPSGAPTGPVVP